MLLIFWISTFLFLLLVTYPLLAYLRALYFSKEIKPSSENLEPVSILISVYNEDKYIRRKVAFFLSQEEWIEGSELIVISTGSTDQSNMILKEFEHFKGFVSIRIDEKIPKTEALNRAVKRAKNNLLVFSDCRQLISQGAVRKLVSYFNDHTIGTVNSTIIDTNEQGKPSVIRKWLNKICLWDSLAGSSLNIHGALYAQRKEVYRDFPTNILFDDLFAVVSTLNQGKRLIQANDVTIVDVPLSSYYDKNRLERLARGMLIYLVGYWSQIKQLPLATLLRFLIYRYLKLFLPFILMGILIPFILFIVYHSMYELLWLAAAVVLILLSFQFVSRQFRMFIKINFSFLTAILKFIFLIDRDTKWDKLTDAQTIIEPKK